MEFTNILLQLLNTAGLKFASQEVALAVGNTDGFKLFVVFEEEYEVLEGDVDVRVTTELALFFEGGLTARESILVDFLLAGRVLVFC